MPNISCPAKLDFIKGLSFLEFYSYTPDKPSFVVDTMDALVNSRVITGATQIVNTDPLYGISQQSQYILVTATAATQVITITKQIDLNNNIFNSGDEAIIAFPIKFIGGAGLATSTEAQRTVDVQITDTASTPVTFGPTGTVAVPEMRYVMGQPVSVFSAVQNLTGLEELIKVPIQKVSQSTTKIVASIQITLNLPVGSVFAIYKSSIYRTDEDLCSAGVSPILELIPDSVKITFTPNIATETGQMKNILSQTAQANSLKISITTLGLDPEKYRKFIGAPKFNDDGQMAQNTITTTIPNNGYLTSAQINGLERVNDETDIMISKIVNGQKVDMGSTQGAVALKDRFKFVKGSQNVIFFNTADIGKTIEIRLVVRDSAYQKMSIPNITVIKKGTLKGFFSSSPEWDSSTSKMYAIFRDMNVTANIEFGDFGNSKQSKINLECEQIVTDLSGSSTDFFYKPIN